MPVTAPAAAPGVVSLGMAARLAEKDAMRRHRIRRRVGVWSGAAVLLLAVVWAVFFSPLLGLQPEKVQITGQGTYIDPAQVTAKIAVADGVPLPRLDTVSLREQITGLVGVRDVQILRDWPNGLTVVLEPREPVAAVPHEGKFALLDGDGIQVASVDAVPEGLPAVDVPLDEAGALSLQAAIVMINALPPELRAEVAKVEAKTQDAVSMTLRDGAQVEWGSSQDAALKVKVLQTLRTAEVSKAAKVFDVSAPTLPITR